MSVIAKFPGIERLGVEERIALAEELWDSVRAEIPQTPEELRFIAEIERRSADSKAHPENLVSWDEAIASRLAL